MDKYRAIYERAGYEVHFVSTYEDTGAGGNEKISQRKNLGPGGTFRCRKILPLTNCIQPQAAMETGISAARLRGDAIPPAILNCFRWRRNTYMMDTPIQLHVYRLSGAGELKDYFPGVQAL